MTECEKTNSCTSVLWAFWKQFCEDQLPRSWVHWWYDSFERLLCIVVEPKLRTVFLYRENINGINYLDMLQSWLIPQLAEHDNTSIFQQDRAAPHFHWSVREFLNSMQPNCWIMGGGAAYEVASSLSCSHAMWLFSVRLCKVKSVCVTSTTGYWWTEIENCRSYRDSWQEHVRNMGWAGHLTVMYGAHVEHL
jgi:hypothetical protein